MDKMVSIILTLIFVIFIVTLAVGFIELSAPIIIKADFDRVCDSYVETAVTEGGLTATQINSLVSDLEALSPSITVNGTTISRVGTVPYKGDISFEVDATYSRSTMVAVLTRQQKSYPFQFNKTFANNVLME
jgi:hypothetical protein